MVGTDVQLMVILEQQGPLGCVQGRSGLVGRDQLTRRRFHYAVVGSVSDATAIVGLAFLVCSPRRGRSVGREAKATKKKSSMAARRRRNQPRQVASCSRR